ncbi:MAG: hypothetical protein HOP31_11390 [Ignavibacteria bacterium]|nr:hypothetical protein [Ignavibacteria bacterium]
MKKLSCFTAFLTALYFIFFIQTSLSQQSRVLEETTKNLHPDYSIQTADNYFLPGEPVPITISSTSITVPSEFTIRVYRINDPELFITKQNNVRQFSVIGADSANLMGLLEETYSVKHVLLPKRIKNTDNLWINREITFTPKRSGAYLVRVTHKDKIATAGFFVTSISILTRYTHGSVLNFTCERKTGAPVDSVKHSLYFNSQKAGEQFSPYSAQNYYFTDSDRELFYRYGYVIPLIISQKNDEVAVSDPDYYFYGKPQPFSALIVTSQPVYRPPGKVDFKISLREMTGTGYMVFAGRNAVLRITDPKGSAVYRKYITTDKFGGFSDSIFIEKEAPLGKYKITVDITEGGDSANENKMIYQSFTQTFGVEEYKKPEYKVEVKTDKKQYSGGEKIEIDIQSDYYFGSPVPDAEVTYDIFKKPLYKPWWYYSEYSWFYRDYYSTVGTENNYEKSQYIFSEKGKLDENGHLKVTYKIDEDFNEGTKKNPYETDYIYIVNVHVTDKSRANVTASTDVNVTRSDYFINAHADRSITSPGEMIGLTVNARDFSDKPVEANYSVSVYRVVYEKKVKLKNYLTTLSGKTSYMGDDVLYIPTEPEGYYEIEVTSFDSKNTKLTAMTGCFVSAGKMSWWERNEGTISILPEKDTYFPGDTAVIFVETPHDTDITLLIDACNKSVVYYSVQQISGGAAYLKIPLSDNSAPNIFIHVSYIKNGILYSNSKPVAVIPRNKFLDVQVTSDKTIYKPQEEGEITVTVKNSLGMPVKNSEVTLGMIDESVYAIAPDNIKDIRGVFYAPIAQVTSLNYNRKHIRGTQYYSVFPGLFEMYNARSGDNKMSFVNTEIYGETGAKFYYAGILINGKYLAGYTNSEGKLNFPLPEGEYDISVIYQNRVLEGVYKMKFTQSGPNLLQLKITTGEILFAELNKNLLITATSKEGFGKLYGTVRDDKGELLIGARVAIEGTQIRTGTDEKGYFELVNIPAGIYSLKCNYVGYDSQVMTNIAVTNNSEILINFELSTGGIVADTIMIISKRNTIDNSSGKIIGSEFIDNTGIRGIENIVAKTSGIIVDENGQEINIRGGRTDGTQIIIDGVVTNNPLEDKNKFVEAVTRSEFKDAALWMPAVYTDENGIAKVKVKFPDNLTSWRVTARVLTDKTDAGQNSYSMTSRKDLIIRVETPRFFQQNDEVTVSTIVHNYLDEEKTAKVTMKLDNLTLLNNESGEQLITLGRNEEKRVDWLVKVNNPVGIGNVLASALTNEESDAMQQLVPLQPFGLKVQTNSAFDLSKSSGGVTKTFPLPEGTDLKSAYLQIGLSPSIASTILGSLDYLIGYPYGCIEQTMSRFMPTLITTNTLKKLGAPLDPYFTEQAPKMLQKGLSKIYSLQKNDGGWGWWPNSASDPYMSAYVVYSLKLATDDSIKTKHMVLDKGILYIYNALGNKKLEPTTRAYITFVLSGFPQTPKSTKLLNKQFELLAKKDISSLAMALLSMAAGNMIKTGTQQKYINSVMREVNYIDDDKAFWKSKIKRYDWQNDEIITTAMVLKAMLADPLSRKENKDMIEKTVNWLLAIKRGNSWGNTLQNAFIIYSLTDYLKAYNELEPDYEIKILVNGKETANKHITKEDIFKKENRFMIGGEFLKKGDNEIRIEKTGAGKSYFTTSFVYYEKENKKEINSTYNGFDIEREYYELKKVFDAKKKIYTYQKSEFKGTITSGSELLVKVKVYPKDPQNEYFMLEDPIPAGCEFIKEDWAYPIENENSYQGRSRGLWNWWYSDMDIRDNRIVFFAASMVQQEYEFSYLLRAQIPGTYNVMPSRGMLMYYPDYNGSGENNIIKITDKQ